MSNHTSEADLVATVANMAKLLPQIAAALPDGITPKSFATEAERLGGSIAAVQVINQKRKGAIAEKRATVKEVKHLLKRIREGVKGHYGDDSVEYSLVGGKRLSERKKPVRKPKVQKAA